jgi:hypothetical protein
MKPQNYSFCFPGPLIMLYGSHTGHGAPVINWHYQKHDYSSAGR